MLFEKLVSALLEKLKNFINHARNLQNMVECLENILSKMDIAKIKGKYQEFVNIELTDICEHILLIYDDEHIKITAQHSLENESLAYLIAQRGKTLPANRKDILHEKLEERNREILENKWHLSKVYQGDVGLLSAAAHWLFTRGDDFYRKAEDELKSQGIPFEFEGNEKSILFICTDNERNRNYFSLTKSGYLFLEENICQLPLIERVGIKICSEARYGFARFEQEHYLVLEGNKREKDGEPIVII